MNFPERAYEIMTAIIRPDSGFELREIRILGVILENSFQLEREYAPIPKLEHFGRLTGQSKGSVSEVLNRLQRNEIVSLNREGHYTINQPHRGSDGRLYLRRSAETPLQIRKLREWLKSAPAQLMLGSEPPSFSQRLASTLAPPPLGDNNAVTSLNTSAALCREAATSETRITPATSDMGRCVGRLPSCGPEGQGDLHRAGVAHGEGGLVSPALPNTEGVEGTPSRSVTNAEQCSALRLIAASIPQSGTPDKAVGTANEVVPQGGTQAKSRFQKMEPAVPQCGTEPSRSAGRIGAQPGTVPNFGTHETPANIEENPSRSIRWNAPEKAAVPSVGTTVAPLNDVNTIRIDRSHPCLLNTPNTTDILRRGFSVRQQYIWDRLLDATGGKLWVVGPQRGYWINTVRNHPDVLEYALEQLHIARQQVAAGRDEVTEPAKWIRGLVRNQLRQRARL